MQASRCVLAQEFPRDCGLQNAKFGLKEHSVRESILLLEQRGRNQEKTAALARLLQRDHAEAQVLDSGCDLVLQLKLLQNRVAGIRLLVGHVLQDKTVAVCLLVEVQLQRHDNTASYEPKVFGDVLATCH